MGGSSGEAAVIQEKCTTLKRQPAPNFTALGADPGTEGGGGGATEVRGRGHPVVPSRSRAPWTRKGQGPVRLLVFKRFYRP
jgi:hypothetical protein